MLRTVLAVALAAALLAVAVPVVEDGRVRHSDRIVRGEIAALRRAATSLLAADETAPGPGARRTVELSLPTASHTSARVTHLTIRGSAGEKRATIAYRIEGGSTRQVPLDVPLYTPGGPVRLSGGGRRRVVLVPVRVDGAVRIRVERGRNPPSVRVLTGGVEASLSLRGPAIHEPGRRSGRWIPGGV